MTITEMIPLLNVEDADRSIGFYRDALGFEVVQTFEAGGATVWAMLKNGDTKLMINQPDHADSTARKTAPSYGGVVLYCYVESARDRHADLTARGVTVGDVSTEAYGMEEFLLRDPDGYEIAIGSRLIRLA
jgi:uncharacterized glyoxalase superfamily protein PhnB